MPRQDAPPIDFDSDARALWSAAQRQLRLQGTWTKSDIPLLQIYVRTVRTAQRAREAADRIPMQKGSNTQLMGHLEMTVAEKAEASALRFASALLLTPESRKRHGVTIPSGATSELDALVG